MNLDKIFHLKENNTNVKTEILAGVTTFMTMAYILAVNPNILAEAGMDHGAVFTATALAAFIGTLCMAIFANYPFALAPGMGLKADFARLPAALEAALHGEQLQPVLLGQRERAMAFQPGQNVVY